MESSGETPHPPFSRCRPPLPPQSQSQSQSRTAVTRCRSIRPLEQMRVAAGLPAFNVVGLPDKAVSEARERVRAALIASGLALPARRITVNMAPADLPKEGSHYDLPIALGLMAAIGAIPHDAVDGFTVLGELGLDGSIAAVAFHRACRSGCCSTTFSRRPCSRRS